MEMAQTNGWAIVQATPPSSAVPIYSKYTRFTELRLVDDNDIYKLATILDSRDCWQNLMGIIPRKMDARACSLGEPNFKEIAKRDGYKYSEEQIKRIANETLAPGQSISQIMIEEWKTSGKYNERPTVGVLLLLLIQAEIYSAADYVAKYFLNESPPARPAHGPAAIIDFNLDGMEHSDDMEVDENPSCQPLNAVAAQVRTSKMNMDYFDKQAVRRDKSMPHGTHGNVGNGESCGERPVRPPRRGSKATTTTTTTTTLSNTAANTSNVGSTTLNMPNLSFLNASSDKLSTNELTPNHSILNGSSKTISSTIMPDLSLIRQSSCEISSTTANASNITTATTTTAAATSSSTATMSNLPAISALNLNTASSSIEAARNRIADDNSSGANSLSHEDDDEEDDEDVDDDDDDDDDDVDDDEEADVSLPNLSNSDHQTSNNDSSLTTVTGTSGENSFELTNDSSSVSNDDNIPNLSEFQQS